MATKKHPKIENAWIIYWYPEGRKGGQKQQTVYDCSEAKAKDIELSLRRRRDGSIKNAANPRMQHVFPEWVAWMKLHRSPKTVESIMYAMKHLEPHFNELTVPQINEAIINKYQKKRKHAPRACNLEIDYLKSCITWMVKRGLCEPLPFKIERLKYHEPIPRIPTPEDFVKWMNSVTNDGPWDKENKRRLPGPKKALLWIMVRAGLRFKEATHIKWQDIDFNQGVIYLTETKGGRPRIAPLPNEANEILKPIYDQLTNDHKDKQPPKGLVAPSKTTGEPYGNMKNLFKTASKRSGVQIKGPHTLRHIHGTYLLAATGDLRLVQASLGHTQIRTTEKYTQIDIERLKRGQAAITHYTNGNGDKNNA